MVCDVDYSSLKDLELLGLFQYSNRVYTLVNVSGLHCFIYHPSQQPLCSTNCINTCVVAVVC